MSLRCVLYFYQKSTNNVQVDEKEPSLHTINKNHPVKYPVLATFYMHIHPSRSWSSYCRFQDT
jgi:hypothetical protein